MIQTKKVIFISIITMLVIVMATTLALIFINQINVTKSDGFSAALASTRAISVDPARDRFREGDKHIDGIVPKYGEQQWNGKIWVDLHVGGESFVFVNVDMRDMGWIKDDLIVEYRSYYKSGSSEVNQKLSNFRFTVQFYDQNNSTAGYHDVNKSNDDQAGFTYPSKSTKIAGAIVRVYIQTTSGVSRTAEFYFGNKYSLCK